MLPLPAGLPAEVEAPGTGFGGTSCVENGLNSMLIFCAVFLLLQVYQPSLGPLAQFLAAHGTAAGLLVLAVPAAAAAGPSVTVQGHQQQVLLKLDASANRDQLMDCSSKVSMYTFTTPKFSLKPLLLIPATSMRWSARVVLSSSIPAYLQGCAALHQALCAAQPARQCAKPLHLLLPLQGNAMGAVSCALPLVAASAGLRFAPLSLMAERVTAGLQVLAAKHR
jgi:hypothetical protein